TWHFSDLGRCPLSRRYWGAKRTSHRALGAAQGLGYNKPASILTSFPREQNDDTETLISDFHIDPFDILRAFSDRLRRALVCIDQQRRQQHGRGLQHAKPRDVPPGGDRRQSRV